MAERVVNGFTLLERLGSGLQGKVYKGRNTSTGEVVALKFIDHEAVRASSKALLNLQREITAMERVAGHPHVICVKKVEYDVSKPRKRRAGTFRRQIMIVMEIAAGGELFNYLLLSQFEEKLSRTYYSQLLEALAHAHAKGIAHRDLKPENLLLDGQFNLRVADWGLSAVLEDVRSALLRTQCGTRSYMAPEVLRGELYNGEAADVWSAGVILFIFLAGFPPFQEAAAGDWWYDRIAARQYPLFWAAHERSARFSPAAKDLLNGIFSADPAGRYRLEDCLKHPWTRGETVTPAELYAEMHGRKTRIRANAGRAMDEDEEGFAAPAARAAADAAAAGGAGAAGATAGAATALGSEVSMASTGGAAAAGALVTGLGASGVDMGLLAGGGGGFMADPFARTTTRGLGAGALRATAHGPAALFAAPSASAAAVPAAAPALPVGKPSFAPRVDTASAPAPAVDSAAGDEAASAGDVLARYAAKASTKIDAAAVAEPLQTAGTAAPAAAAAGEAEAEKRVTALTVRGAPSAALVAQAIAGYLESAMHATVAAKVHAPSAAGEAAAAAAASGEEAASGIKLKVSVPAGGAPLRFDVRLLAGPDGSVVADFQRSAGNVLGFNATFARVGAAFDAVVAKE